MDTAIMTLDLPASTGLAASGANDASHDELRGAVFEVNVVALMRLQDVIDRMPGLGTRGAYLKQLVRDKLIEHEHSIDKHGEDLPEIIDWKWGDSP